MKKTYPQGMLTQNQQEQPSSPPAKQQGGVPPELQGQYDMFVANGLRMLFGDQRQAHLERLKSGDLAQGAGELLVDIVSALEKNAAQKGIQLDQSVLLHGANEILGNILEYASSAGLGDLAEQERAGVIKYAIGRYLNDAVESGRMSREQVAEMGRPFMQDQMNQGGA